MLTHSELVKKMMKKPGVKREYVALAPEFGLLDELLRARHNAGMTQAQVAAKMGTKTPAIARLEAGGGRQGHSPSIATLQKYATAVGCQLEVRLRPQRKRKRVG
jgi:transcriptional regulator with XRE-family HTH domain